MSIVPFYRTRDKPKCHPRCTVWDAAVTHKESGSKTQGWKHMLPFLLEGTQ